MKIDFWNHWNWDKHEGSFQLLHFGYENYKEKLTIYLVFFNFVLDIELLKVRKDE